MKELLWHTKQIISLICLKNKVRIYDCMRLVSWQLTNKCSVDYQPGQKEAFDANTAVQEAVQKANAEANDLEYTVSTSAVHNFSEIHC